MTITIDLPQELEQELSSEAEKINLSLSEYVLYVLCERQGLNNSPKTGGELVNYWHNEGLINSRPDIENSQEYARKIRYEAENSQQI